ncbi:MAG: tRNA (adenosine(37)-N6)-threonylcarbamoyltransferase complex ATPase subunit type 1 TsaE [Candidatus Paceibacterota bacterium]
MGIKSATMPYMQRTFDIQSMEALEVLATTVCKKMDTIRNDTAVVLALSGELGTGKTTFVQTLARILGVKEVVTSPTFTIMKSYKTNNPRFKTLIHIDAYRIESIDEMRVLGFEALLQTNDTLLCIEWPERIHQLIPSDTVQILFALQEDTRTAIVSFNENE